MALTFAYLTVRPDVGTLAVTLSGVGTVYSDQAQTQSVSFPDTISVAKTYYFAQRGTLTISTKYNNVEIAGPKGTTLTRIVDNGYGETISPALDITESFNEQTGSFAVRGVSADAVQYVSRSALANDANDGLSMGTAKATIAAALTALGGPGRVQLLHGKFTSGATGLAPTTGQEIVGCGWGNSTILNDATSNAAVTLPATGTWPGCVLRDVQIGAGAGTADSLHVGTAASTNAADGHRLNSVWLDSQPADTIHAYGAIGLIVEDCVFRNSIGTFTLDVNASAVPSNMARISNCYFTGGAPTGPFLNVVANTDGGLFQGNVFESRGGTYAAVVVAGNDATFQGNHLEANGNGPQQLTLSGSRNVVLGNTFAGGTGVVRDYLCSGTRNLIEGNTLSTGTSSITGNFNVSRNNTFTSGSTISIGTAALGSYRERDFDGTTNNSYTTPELIVSGYVSVGAGAISTLATCVVPTGTHGEISEWQIHNMSAAGSSTIQLDVYDTTASADVSSIAVNCATVGEQTGSGLAGGALTAGHSLLVRAINNDGANAHNIAYTVKLRFPS